MRKGKTFEAIKVAYRKGYRVQPDGSVQSAHNRTIKLSKTQAGYLKFTIKVPGEKWASRVMVHQLVAFQKFGEEEFSKNPHVRHLDGNPMNNHPDNIAVGSEKDNSMDKLPEVRKKTAENASRHIVRTDWDLIDADRAKGMSYRDISKKHKISKGTLSYRYSKRAGHLHLTPV